MFNSVEEIEEVNQELIEIENEWYNSVKCDILDFNIEGKREISLPFYPGVSNRAINKPIAMIVGQETRNHGRYEDYDKIWQKPSKYVIDWAVRQTDRHIDCKKYERSHFWNFIKDVYNIGFYPYWTNVDKVHKYTNNNMSKLTAKLEIKFNKTFDYNNVNQSILLHEIDVVKPKIVVFLTGDKYYKTMSQALSINLYQMKENSPNLKDKIFTEIELNKSVFTIWTHHPRVLQKNGLRQNNWSGILDKIKEHL